MTKVEKVEIALGLKMECYVCKNVQSIEIANLCDKRICDTCCTATYCKNCIAYKERVENFSKIQNINYD